MVCHAYCDEHQMFPPKIQYPELYKRLYIKRISISNVKHRTGDDVVSTFRILDNDVHISCWDVCEPASNVYELMSFPVFTIACTYASADVDVK